MNPVLPRNPQLDLHSLARLVGHYKFDLPDTADDHRIRTLSLGVKAAGFLELLELYFSPLASLSSIRKTDMPMKIDTPPWAERVPHDARANAIMFVEWSYNEYNEIGGWMHYGYDGLRTLNRPFAVSAWEGHNATDFDPEYAWGGFFVNSPTLGWLRLGGYLRQHHICPDLTTGEVHCDEWDDLLFHGMNEVEYDVEYFEARHCVDPAGTHYEMQPGDNVTDLREKGYKWVSLEEYQTITVRPKDGWAIRQRQTSRQKQYPTGQYVPGPYAPVYDEIRVEVFRGLLGTFFLRGQADRWRRNSTQLLVIASVINLGSIPKRSAMGLDCPELDFEAVVDTTIKFQVRVRPDNDSDDALDEAVTDFLDGLSATVTVYDENGSIVTVEDGIEVTATEK